MVSLETRQTKQNTERFFHQLWLFKYFQNTIPGINKMFNFRFEITIYGIALIQISKDSYNVYWRYSNPLKITPK